MSNPVDKARAGRTKDARDPASSCSFKQRTIQLIPVRYGLVEASPVSEQLALPFKTQSKPLGVRLLRSGWLYIVVEFQGRWLLHEYRIEQGKITKLLWSDAEVYNDVRTNSVGEAKLIFPATSVLYCCYSELQWTAVKCSQVIGSGQDRERFMQKVVLSECDAVNGGKDLLTSEQASQLIAECAEQQDQEGSLYEPYQWEHQPLFNKLDFSAVHSSVDVAYQDDHLYLVLKDDIGVLRDLAAYQSLVADSLQHWMEDEERYQKYIEGSYITTQIELSPEKIDELAVMLGSETLAADLTTSQKEAVTEWIEWITEDRPKYITARRGGVHFKQKVRQKKQALKDTLGSEMMAKYQEVIDDIEEQYDTQVNGISGWNFLSSRAGTPGIKDLIHQQEMDSFLEQEGHKLASWNNLLESISEDRTRLFNRFYSAAWYYDSTSSVQLGELIAAEYSCIQDICYNDIAAQRIAEQLEEIPWVATYRGIHTLDAQSYDALTKKILKSIQELKKVHAVALDKELALYANHINSLIGEYFRVQSDSFAALHESVQSYSRLVDSAYTPANMLALSATTEELLNNVQNNRSFDLNKVLRRYSGAAWLNLLDAYNTTGITVKFAGDQQRAEFNQQVEKAEALRKNNNILRNRVRHAWALHRKRNHPGQPDVFKWNQEHRVNQGRLAQLEAEISAAITPYGEGAGKVGFTIKNLPQGAEAELKAMAADHRAAKQVKLSHTLSKWDGLSAVLAFFAVCNAVKTLSNSDKVSRAHLVADVSNALSATLGLAQGIRAGVDQAAYKVAQHSLGKLAYSARLGKWTTILGGGAYLFGIGASGAKSYDAYKKLKSAMQQGDNQALIRHSIDTTAEVTMTLVNGYGFTQSARVGWAVLKAEQGARAAIWAGNSARLLSIGARLNLIGVIVSAVQQAGTVWYNRVNLSHYMQWFQSSRWGTKSAYASLQHSNEALAKITAKPLASLAPFKGDSILWLTLPAITIDQLDNTAVEVAVYWLEQGRWLPWTDAIQQQWVSVITPGKPLEIGLPVFTQEMNAEHGIAIELHYLATPDSTEKTVVRYQRKDLSITGPLNEVGALEAAETAAQDLRPLTTDTLQQLEAK